MLAKFSGLGIAKVEQDELADIYIVKNLGDFGKKLQLKAALCGGCRASNPLGELAVFTKDPWWVESEPGPGTAWFASWLPPGAEGVG